MSSLQFNAIGAVELGLQKQDALLDYAISHSPAIFYIAELHGDRKVTFISPNIENITGHRAVSVT